MRLRLAGEGEHPETGGEPGDLYIFITVEPDAFFTREGDDLHYELTIPYTRAILGDEHVVDVFGDQVLVRVPQGAQPNDEIRIKGKGAARVGRDTVGDLVIKIRVTLPENPSAEELKLISKLDKLIGITHKKAGHG
jgi:molecular chaperone DnaJ